MVNQNNIDSRDLERHRSRSFLHFERKIDLAYIGGTSN